MKRPWEAPRTKVTGRITGKLIQWRGKFGFIKPSVPVDHPEGGKRGGKVYIGQEDVEAEIVVNDHVSFIAYVDNTGLGAMHCRPASESQLQATRGKGGAGKSAARFAPSRAPGPSRPSAAPSKPPVKAAPAKAQSGSAGGSHIHGTVLKFIPKRGVGGGKGSNQDTAAEDLAEEENADDGEAAQSEPAQEDKEVSEAPPAPDKSMRERLLEEKIIGKITRWRGHTGWIRPNQPIDHPDAATFRKSLYLHESDVEEGQELYQGAQVEFFLFSDSHGVGAEEVMLTEDQPGLNAEEPAEEDAEDKKGKGPMNGKLKKKRGGKGSKGGKGEPRQKLPSGPDLTRERITDIPVAGEVVEWKRNFGWVKPSEDIEHEKAGRHQGKIYLHQKDVLPEGPLEVGQQVEFHVYADDSGLGGEECVVMG